MKILIVEDDPLAAEFIENLIRDNFPSSEICGNVKTVPEASRCFNLKRPDVLIMDINLGDHTSFELFDYIDPSLLTVIFTSSYDEFALKAMKVDAVDYLLKPVNVNEFKRAMEKVQKRIAILDQEELNRKAKAALHSDKANINVGEKRILLFENGKMNPILLDHIVKINSDRAYSKIHLKDNKVLTSSKGLSSYEKLLKDIPFLRIHHSCLVNYYHIQSYTPGQKAYITLSNGAIEYVARAKKRKFLNIYMR